MHCFRQDVTWDFQVWQNKKVIRHYYSFLITLSKIKIAVMSFEVEAKIYMNMTVLLLASIFFIISVCFRIIFANSTIKINTESR